MEKEIKDKPKCTSDNRNTFFSTILLVSGIIFLLNNFGLVSWNVWGTLWKLWPLFLIFWGIEAIFGKSLLSGIVITIISLFVGLFILVYSLSLADSGFDRWASRKYPLWAKIKQNLPETKNKDFLFECSPFNKNCYKYFNN